MSCEKCKDKGYLIEVDEVKFCDCEKGKKLEEVEKKRNQKGYRDNY